MSPSLGLTSAGCRQRQEALRLLLEKQGLAAALITDRRHVHYLTGYWCRAVFTSLVLLERDGPTVLVIPVPSEESFAADDVLVYPSNQLGTLIDDHGTAALEPVRERLSRFGRLGCDGAVPACLCGAAEWVDIQPLLLHLRRRKAADEVALLREAIAATEAAYGHARAALAPGITEVDLFAGMQAAAAAHAGETLGEFGNDFQIGALGSPPRRRPAVTGEVAVFDLSVVLRGYRSDMCRSLIVAGQPSADQIAARERILEVLAYVEQTARPGVPCRHVFETAHTMLAGYRGWSFPHHLGHGIGLSAHEAPRLNPHWNDTFESGDIFTVEPGLYGSDLRAGLRIEEIYLMTEVGPEKLTTFPTALV